MSPPKWDRASLSVVTALCGFKAILHLLIAARYGYHADELYFIECGRRLAFGYVDHPPLIPFLARLADEAGGGIALLRLPAVVASTGTMILTALFVRDWGGGWRAQMLALLCLLFAPAHLRLAAMLNIPVVEVFLCTAAAYLVHRALSHDQQRLWVIAGGVLGLAILAKHSSILWAGAVFLGVLATPQRRSLASAWPWLGVTLAAVLFLPNLIWQVENGFPTLEFMRTLRMEVLREQGRGLFLAGLLLYFHPLAVPVWVGGLASAFTPAGHSTRVFAVLFLVMLGFLFVVGGKPYYLASAYPPVLAAGGVALERWFATRVASWRTFATLMTSTGLVLGLISLPVLPLRTLDAIIEALLGWAVPAMGLTHDLHGMYGWDVHAATVDRVYESLSPADRERATVLVQTYSQASALNVLRNDPVPRAVCGSMSYYLWGPDGDRGDVVISYGFPVAFLHRHYRTCTESARIQAPLARPWDTDLPVYVCREPLGTMATLWPEIRQFGHAPAVTTFGLTANRR